MKTILTVAAVVLVGFGLMWWGRTNQAPLPAQASGGPSTGAATTGGQKSELAAPEILYDFGTISMKNGLVYKEFSVTNPTEKDITVSSMFTSCMCTTAYLLTAEGSVKGPFRMPGMGYIPPANETLKPGESRTVRVVYDPNAHGPAGVGQIDRFVTLTDEAGGVLQLDIKALVTP
ncbi:MAG: DUF1573 domain-containing protein [bacterium]|nr:DUF1573 domain-containing protein [bacterium]